MQTFEEEEEDEEIDDDDNGVTEDVEEKGNMTQFHPALMQCQLNRFGSESLSLI